MDSALEVLIVLLDMIAVAAFIVGAIGDILK